MAVAGSTCCWMTVILEEEGEGPAVPSGRDSHQPPTAQVQPHEAQAPTPSGAGQSRHLSTWGLPSPSHTHHACSGSIAGDKKGCYTCSRDVPFPPGHSLWLTQPLPPSSAGYQGSFHSIQNCFPYGDGYRVAEPAASGDALAGEAPGFNPLRPNGYHSLSAPLPATGKPHLHGSLPRTPT